MFTYNPKAGQVLFKLKGKEFYEDYKSHTSNPHNLEDVIVRTLLKYKHNEIPLQEAVDKILINCAYGGNK
jgi:hypothetical protein